MSPASRACRELPPWEYKDYLGWHEQGDGKLAYGVFVQSGRVQGEQKKALRRLIERYELPITLTAQQNLILQDVDPAWKQDVQDTLAAAGLACAPMYLLTRISDMSMHLSACWLGLDILHVKPTAYAVPSCLTTG